MPRARNSHPGGVDWDLGKGTASGLSEHISKHNMMLSRGHSDACRRYRSWMRSRYPAPKGIDWNRWAKALGLDI